MFNESLQRWFVVSAPAVVEDDASVDHVGMEHLG